MKRMPNRLKIYYWQFGNSGISLIIFATVNNCDVTDRNFDDWTIYITWEITQWCIIRLLQLIDDNMTTNLFPPVSNCIFHTNMHCHRTVLPCYETTRRHPTAWVLILVSGLKSKYTDWCTYMFAEYRNILPSVVQPLHPQCIFYYSKFTKWALRLGPG